MHAPSSSLHVYSRQLTDDEHSSLRTLADLVTPNSTVLDLGCGTGALGTWLTTHKNCTADGLTLSDAEAEQARSHYRHVVVGNLETDDICEHFGHSTYDFIVCADVLEHLKDPARTLAACHRLLSPAGSLLVSVPNVAYAGLVAELMAGQFGYRDEGLLDKTHLRFFTRSTLLTFLAENRWEPAHVYPIGRDILDSEFKVSFEAMPPAVSRYLTSAPDAGTYQFVVSCTASQASNEVIEALLQAPLPQPVPEFTCELFLRDESGYSQRNKLTRRGVIGESRQTLSFSVPLHPNGWLALRLDPADRPGIMHLYGMRLLDSSSQAVWEWRHGASIASTSDLHLASHHQIFWDLQADTLPGQTMILLGVDPWVELPIPPACLQAESQTPTHLEVEVGWPMSADYLVLSRNLTHLQHALTHARLEHQQEQQRYQSELQNLHADFDERKRLMVADLKQAHLALEHAQTECMALTSRLRELDTSLQAQQQLTQCRDKEVAQAHHAYQQIEAANQKLRTDLSQLQDHLQWIENSTVFKVTRPLVRMKMALDNLRKPVQPTPVLTNPEPLSAVVDVIVPVYKGLFDTQRCIRSVLASSCQTPFRLLVVNDASPEPEVTQWLRAIAATDPRITLLENPENLGFVGTVNRGMSHGTEHDVLLLNSDTEVANDWLDRLRRAAYSQPRVASVTPFSNNATICSYPRFCEANPLVDGYTTESLDAIFAQANPGVAIDVPTGVGFCMYIRRESLNELGLFDVANFGKGYGEENDYCCRASSAGWRNLHALDTFVHHAGGISFGDSKSARELAAMETLRRLHPNYEADVMRFVQNDPAKPYRHAVDLARLSQSPLTKVLAVTHDRAGGTLLHVKELTDTLKSKAHFLCLTPTPGGRVQLEWIGQFEGLRLEFAYETEFDALIHTLKHAGVGLVHYHHLLGHHPRVQGIPMSLEVPFDFTAHDHYSHCPQITLTDITNQYCGELGVSQCNECLQRSPAPGGVDITVWRGNHQTFLRKSRFVLAPSQDTAQRMIRLVPEANIRVAPHTDLSGTTPLPLPAPARLRESGRPLKIVVLGALSIIKGADVLEDLAIAARKAQAPLEFHLIGYAYRHLKTRPGSFLTVHGEYKESDLADMFDWLQPDLAWFPALWPETYSYTLSACLKAGLPVVAPDLGAFSERLHNRAWSWIRPWNSTTEDWLSFFTDIYKQHFLTGIPPSPHTHVGGSPTPNQNWDYHDTYLPKAGPHITPREGSSLTADWLHAYRTGRPQGGLQGATVAAKRGVLSAMIRLRSAAGLRHVARRVPLRWQTRIKSWLLR